MHDPIGKAIERAFEKSHALDRERDEREAIWLRQVLILASGALAVLAGLGPAVPSEGLAKYFLTATWGLLGVGITTGAAATYTAANHAKRVAERYRSHLEESTARVDEYEERIRKSDMFRKSEDAIEERSDIEVEIDYGPGYDTVPKNKALVVSKSAMILSLLVAVLCLATYAIIRTLGI